MKCLVILCICTVIYSHWNFLIKQSLTNEYIYRAFPLNRFVLGNCGWCYITSLSVNIDSHESTWFSKDSMTGKGDVLKAHSAMASITSWKTQHNSICRQLFRKQCRDLKLNCSEQRVCCVYAPWKRFLTSSWSRVWWQAPPQQFVLSTRPARRSGILPGGPACTSPPRSFLPAVPLKHTDKN